MKLLNLFIDESGNANPKGKKSKCYILSGCLVSGNSRDELKIKADQIKFKYWGRTNLVFHSREIGRKEGNFIILKNKKINEDFQRDLLNFLFSGVYQLFITVVNINKALIRNWNTQKVYKETANILIKNFILALLASGNIKGRLVIESATSEKDFVFHKTVGYYLSNGLKEIKISYKKVQEVLTEIAFVSKKNFDIEEQIADLIAYGAKLKFLKKRPESMSAYEKSLVRIMEKKIFQMHPDTGTHKKKFYSLIEGFKILP